MKFAVVASQARGRWHGILTSLGVPPESLTPKHGPCPACGGKDRFKFDNLQDRGTFICGRGGDPIAGDGFALVQHLLDCNPADALRAVSQVLGGNHEAIPLARPQRPPEPSKTQAYGFALWAQAERSDAAVADHRYAKARGIGWAAGAGRVRASGGQIGRNTDCVIVPVRDFDTQNLIAVECISDRIGPDGKYIRQAFGPKGEGLLLLGNRNNHALERHVCEGWATGVRLWRAKGDIVVAIAFGKASQRRIADWIEINQPGGLVYIAKEVDYAA